jgi:hypothetical protein
MNDQFSHPNETTAKTDLHIVSLRVCIAERKIKYSKLRINTTEK